MLRFSKLKRNSLKASIALSHENAHSQLESLGKNQDAKSLDDILKSIDSVSANDINAVRYILVLYTFCVS
jgi:hypothetical protein